VSRETLRSRIAVVGVGTTAFGALPGYTTADLGLWALHEALADCGLPATAIDGLIVTRIADNAAYAEAAGISPDFSLVMPPLGHRNRNRMPGCRVGPGTPDCSCLRQ
jgi:hypothetical protein